MVKLSNCSIISPCESTLVYSSVRNREVLSMKVDSTLIHSGNMPFPSIWNGFLILFRVAHSFPAFAWIEWISGKSAVHRCISLRRSKFISWCRFRYILVLKYLRGITNYVIPGEFTLDLRYSLIQLPYDGTMK